MATNVYGQSAQSNEGNGAYYTREPDAPISLSEDVTLRTATQIGLAWSDGANNGGTQIHDYSISQREQGQTDFIQIASLVTEKTYTAIELTLGTTYEFKVEARNDQGYSDASQVFQTLHAVVPETLLQPSTLNSGTDIVINWAEPNYTGDNDISYRITIV